ncbi:MAG: BON domain-containing protein [Burkholderiales bacterium]|nr:BON domain-containing protein [Burkholderiales bacterium]
MRGWVLAGTLASSLLGLLGGCAPLLLGGAVIGTGIVVTDRRTTGMQLEDKTIETKGESRARGLATLGRINVSSYNRTVLITGEVPGETERATVERAVAGVENVRTVINELAVAPNLSVAQRSSDSLLGAKVKASLVDAKDVAANAYRVIAERGVVYLMGRVTEREATRAVELARSVPGVVKVVRVLDIITEEELAAMSGGKK